MTPLDIKIRDQIKADGPLRVSEFMEIALSDPSHGYYLTRDPLGEAGDFITSPEISQVFGEIIGLWCAVAWQDADTPRKINLVELGPGRGTLIADILRTARNVMPEFAEAIDVHLVETGAVLREQQRSSLNDYDVEWHDRFDSVPEGPLLIVANEFFDALPIEQYIQTEEGWQERRLFIDKENENLFFGPYPPASKNLIAIPDVIRDSSVGSIFERSVAAEQVVGEITDRMVTEGGAALIIDYGHVRHGVGDTLQAIRSHKYHDPLLGVGEIDLTAHVDFAALQSAAQASKGAVFGPIFQGEFLTALGIEQRTNALTKNAPTEQADVLTSGSRRLIAADGMGTLFKIMSITPSAENSSAGFENIKEGIVV